MSFDPRRYRLESWNGTAWEVCHPDTRSMTWEEWREIAPVIRRDWERWRLVTIQVVEEGGRP